MLSEDMLCIAGFDGYFKRLNPAWERVLGFTTAQLCAEPYLELVHPDDREATMKAANRVGSGNNVLRFDNRYGTAGGSYRWLSWTAVPYVEERTIYADARDITETRSPTNSSPRTRTTSRWHARRKSKTPHASHSWSRARPREGESGGGGAGEGGVPRQHEPRDPHADDRDHRHGGPRARTPSSRTSSAST